MKAASSSDIKKELKEKTETQLIELCLRLARFKKENKELLTYLLFESDDLETYIHQVKQEIDDEFGAVNARSLYLAKKTIRKILRIINKHIRYTGSAEAEVELLLHFCGKLQRSGINYSKSTALLNLYNSQIKKIRAAIDTLHEDLQHDYLMRLEEIG